MHFNLKNFTKLCALTLTLSALLITSINANAVDIAQDQVRTIYLPYGSQTADTDIRNALARLTLEPGMEFVAGSFADLYLGSPNRPDSETPPASPTCNSSYSGPVYPINASLVSPNAVNYGLQSARNTGSGSGSSNPQTLREKHTGCIRFQVAVTDAAQVGDEIILTYDEDFGDSPDYQANRKPQVITIPFTITQAQNPVSSSSSVSSSVSSSEQSSVSSSPDDGGDDSASSAESSSVSSSTSTVNVPTSPAPINNGGGTGNPGGGTGVPALDNTPRSGGVETAAIIGAVVLVIGGFVAYKIRSANNLKKIDVGGTKKRK